MNNVDEDTRQKIYEHGDTIPAIEALIPNENRHTLKWHYRICPEICEVADRILTSTGGATLLSTQHYQGPTPGVVEDHVHLNIKQARTVSIAIFPGVNVTFPLAESGRIDKASKSAGSVGKDEQSRRIQDEPLLKVLAEALAPYLLEFLAKPQSREDVGYAKKGRRKSVARESKLPFWRFISVIIA